MISLSSQIQAMLDSVGIQLDSESFENLIRLLHINKLNWYQKTAIAVGLSVLVQWLQKRAEEQKKAASLPVFDLAGE